MERNFVFLGVTGSKHAFITPTVKLKPSETRNHSWYKYGAYTLKPAGGATPHKRPPLSS